MATAARAAASPRYEMRKAGAPTPASTNFVNSSNSEDNVIALRLQRLKLSGIIGQRAQLLADLAWGASQ